MTKKYSLIIIDTDNYILAKEAVRYSLSRFKFDDLIIFSDIQRHWGDFSIHQINKINSINDYNNICINILPHFVKTDFVIIIQYDGFILNPSVWDSFFNNFDYIGAPWFDQDGWIVGNGGFSFRSMRILEEISNTAYNSSSIPEDVFICKSIRSELINKNFHFAPLEVARRFAFEWPNVKWDTFGFHGIFNLPKVYKNNIKFLLDSLSKNTLFRRWRYVEAGLSLHAPVFLPYFYEIIKSNGIVNNYE